MGRLALVQHSIDARVVASQGGGDQQEQQIWPPLPLGMALPLPPGPVPVRGINPIPLPPPFIQPHGQAWQATAVRQQAPMLHRMAAPAPAPDAAVRLQGTPARVGTPRPQRHPATPGLAPAGAGFVRGTNPYSYVAQHLCQPTQQGARYAAPGQQPYQYQPYQYQPYQQQQYVPRDTAPCRLSDFREWRRTRECLSWAILLEADGSSSRETAPRRGSLLGFRRLSSQSNLMRLRRHMRGLSTVGRNQQQTGFREYFP
jgi:hypothetical protein